MSRNYLAHQPTESISVTGSVVNTVTDIGHSNHGSMKVPEEDAIVAGIPHHGFEEIDRRVGAARPRSPQELARDFPGSLSIATVNLTNQCCQQKSQMSGMNWMRQREQGPFCGSHQHLPISALSMTTWRPPGKPSHCHRPVPGTGACLQFGASRGSPPNPMSS
jgi:hypothetical protein